MSETPNDSPAFRLRPRSEPKSYYTIRLEYSANPAAFTRERPRSSLTKRRSTSTKVSYSKARSRGPPNTSRPIKLYVQDPLDSTQSGLGSLDPPLLLNVVDLEREERRKQLRRELALSITTNRMISPFVERLELEELKPDSLYGQNYITLKIERITKVEPAAASAPSPPDGKSKRRVNKHIICRCSGTDSSTKNVYLDVHLHNEYAREDIVEVDKIMSVAKFRTGPLREPVQSPETNSDSSYRDLIGFDVIVKYEAGRQSASNGAPGASKKLRDRIPYVCIGDRIEEPTDPYVEMPPPSPPLPPQLQQPKPYLPLEPGTAAGSSQHQQDTKVHIAND